MDIQATLDQFPWLWPLIKFVILLIGVFSLYALLKKFVVNYVLLASEKMPRFWGQRILDENLLSRVLLVLPIAVVMFSSRLVPDLPETLLVIIERVAQSTMLIIILRAVSAFLGNINDAYSTLEISKNRPIKGFIQVFLILLYLLTFILIISILVDKSPWVFLSGLGAMTAVLLLVFRDTLLSLVAGLQLTSNNYVRVGDWIEMPQFSADGDVIDIALHAVRVQNWDRTITTIPTHKFLEHAFKNWRGMQESGGRRIKRSIHIDMSSIHFLSADEIKHLGKFVLLQEYIPAKLEELKNHNSKYAHDPELIVNSRRLTNIGTFRAYLINYLRQHPKIHQDMTFLVRQLAPGETGLPIEIYVFTNDIRWAFYEGIQADIFDHVIAISKEFGLKIFQNPSGNDFQDVLKLNSRLN